MYGRAGGHLRPTLLGRLITLKQRHHYVQHTDIQIGAISSNDLREVSFDVFHCLAAEMLAVVNVSETQNAKAVGVVKLLLHVPSTGLEHCNHLQQQQQSAVNQHSHVMTCYTYNARP